MQPTAEQVQHYIETQLPCTYICVKGDGAHFHALIVSAEFEGKPRLARHQLVYATLGERILGSQAEIHALAMTTLTPAEYQAQAHAPAANQATTATALRQEFFHG